MYELEEIIRESNKVQKVRDISIEKVLDEDIASESVQSKLLYDQILGYKQKIREIEGNIQQMQTATESKARAKKVLEKEYSEILSIAKKLRIDVEEGNKEKDSANERAQFDKIKRSYGISMKVTQQSMTALVKKEQQLKQALKVSEKKKTEVIEKIDKVNRELKETAKEIDSYDYAIETDRSTRSNSLNTRNRNSLPIRQNLKSFKAPSEIRKKPSQLSNQTFRHVPKIFLRSVENSPEKLLKNLNYKYQSKTNRSNRVSSNKSFKKELKSLTPTQLYSSNDIPDNLTSFFLKMEKTSDFKCSSKKQFGTEQDFMPNRLDVKLPEMEFSYESPVKHGNKHNNMENHKMFSNLPIIVEVDNFQFSEETFHKDDDC